MVLLMPSAALISVTLYVAMFSVINLLKIAALIISDI